MPLETVEVCGRIEDAMRAIDRSGAEVALVTKGGRFVGTLTDGDVRRALLGGATLQSSLEPYVGKQPTCVSTTVGRAEVLDLMQARRISQVPILDADGKLAGLHLLHDILGVKERPNIAVVMAGGLGTRLRPLTASIPKPMVKVAGRPILERIVLHLVSHGIRRIYLAVNYLGVVIEEHFGNGSRFGCGIEYIREDESLGTGGALALLPAQLEPLLVMNGDLVTQADVGAMLDFHAKGWHQATIGVRRYFHSVPYGVVEPTGNKVLLIEKPQVSWLVNAGIYVLDPSLPMSVPRGEYALTNLFAECTARAFEIEDEWMDVGQHEHLREARGA